MGCNCGKKKIVSQTSTQMERLRQAEVEQKREADEARMVELERKIAGERAKVSSPKV